MSEEDQQSQQAVVNDSKTVEDSTSRNESLEVSGPEFLSALKDAMVEIDASAKHREEVQAIAGFLVAFYIEDSSKPLSREQLSQLTFTFRIESIEKTRTGLLNMFSTDASIGQQTRRYNNYYLVPTEAFVSYLCTRTYYRMESPESVASTAFRFPIRQSGIKNFWTTTKHQMAGTEDESKDGAQTQVDVLEFDADIKWEKFWTRQEFVLCNFLHFLVNIFCRTIPGNLLYGFDNASCSGDFFICINFLQETLLTNPMDLKSIYERIWEQFQRLNREAEHHARISELKLFCQPIINNNWQASVQRHASGTPFITKDAFVRVCSDCILWTESAQK